MWEWILQGTIYLFIVSFILYLYFSFRDREEKELAQSTSHSD